ncbi:unnamed protein product [Cylindrotheca closterium]|uniref:Uncharacterized protein n=1 Tax=Cylindrotheca closterium TaxID=2856 RepID=A0AAD2CF76_9STRA|nr:unnamed protein product [Cylindrotheca closterium]
MKEYKTDRKVSFEPTKDTIILVSGREDFTDEEKKLYWYSALEKEKMHDQCFKDAMRLELEEVKNPSCYRGMEPFTTEGEQSSTNAINACIDAVMDEQDRQWERREDDYDRIAAISQEVSKCSVDRAIMRAIEDAREAIRINITPKQNVSGTSEHAHRSLSSEPGFEMKEPVVTRKQREIFSMMIEHDMISGHRRRGRNKKDCRYDSDKSRANRRRLLDNRIPYKCY